MTRWATLRDAHPTISSLGRIPLAHAVDQRVFPIREAAETERDRVGAAVVHVAIELPGETHAAMDLDVVLGTMLERLRRAYARGPDRRPILEMLMVSIDISDVSFT